MVTTFILIQISLKFKPFPLRLPVRNEGSITISRDPRSWSGDFRVSGFRLFKYWKTCWPWQRAQWAGRLPGIRFSLGLFVFSSISEWPHRDEEGQRIVPRCTEQIRQGQGRTHRMRLSFQQWATEGALKVTLASFPDANEWPAAWYNTRGTSNEDS